MEIDIETIVYLIFTIIFVAIGALGKRKKSKQPQPVSAAEEEMQEEGRTFSENFNSLLRDVDERLGADVESSVDLLGESDDSVESQAGSTLDSSFSSIDIPESMIDTVPDKTGKEKHPEKLEDQYQRLMNEIKPPKKVYYRNQNEFIDEFREDFEPRKGIIYSELFNPKYF